MADENATNESTTERTSSAPNNASSSSDSNSDGGSSSNTSSSNTSSSSDSSNSGRSSSSSGGGYSGGGNRPPRGGSGGGGGRPRGGGGRSGGRYFERRRKVVPIKAKDINWKNLRGLRYFLNDDGSIRSSRKTGANARLQRRAVQAIKRARYMALLPYAGTHVRTEGERLGRDLPDFRPMRREEKSGE